MSAKLQKTKMNHSPSEDPTSLVIEVFDANGRLVSRDVGPTAAELLALHAGGRCCFTCSHCHQEIADKIGEDAAIEIMLAKGRESPA